jgi:prolyl-tRNA editing enzyme YbaK/EbsC (Cys-tRNA(Pro) deacylase)
MVAAARPCRAAAHAGGHGRLVARRDGAPIGVPVVPLRAMSDHDSAGRAWLMEHLDPLGVDYELFACDPTLADTAAFCAAYGFAPDESANTIVVIGKSDPPRYAACVTLAPNRLDVNRTVRDRLGTRKASFAPADQAAALTGMQIGGVTVFGLPPGIPIWVDARVMTRERIVLGGGSRSWKVIAGPAILRALPGVEIVDGLANEPGPPA